VKPDLDSIGEVLMEAPIPITGKIEEAKNLNIRINNTA
jgi:hypothetical protein